MWVSRTDDEQSALFQIVHQIDSVPRALSADLRIDQQKDLRAPVLYVFLFGIQSAD